MDEEALNASVRKFLKKLGGSRSPHPSKPKTAGLKWRARERGIETPRPCSRAAFLHRLSTSPRQRISDES